LEKTEEKYKNDTNKVLNKEDIYRENKIKISDSADDNLSLIKEMAENKEENILQLLKRKKLLEEENKEKGSVNFLKLII
jgi:hypothetical protein